MYSNDANRNPKRRRLKNEGSEVDDNRRRVIQLGKTLEDHSYLNEKKMKEQEAMQEEMNESYDDFVAYCERMEYANELLAEPMSQNIVQKLVDRSNNILDNMREQQRLLDHWFAYLRQTFFINTDIIKDFQALMESDEQTKKFHPLITRSSQLMAGMLIHRATIEGRHEEYLAKFKIIKNNTRELCDAMTTEGGMNRSKKNLLHRLVASNEDLILETKNHQEHLIGKCKTLRPGMEVLDQTISVYTSTFSKETIEAVLRVYRNSSF